MTHELAFLYLLLAGKGGPTFDLTLTCWFCTSCFDVFFDALYKGAKIQPRVVLTEAFENSLGSWTSAPSGHEYLRRNACFFSRISRALTEVWGRDIRANDPRMSAGHLSPKLPLFRKIPVSAKFVSAILGPEMGAPILWTPGKMRSFCRKNHVRKIPLFWGGGGF